MSLKFTNPIFRFLFIAIICLSIAPVSFSQVKILFDATKAESASNADWVIDADLHNIGWSPGAAVNSGNESNAQRIPTPAQAGVGVTVAESYWQGGLSFWGVDCAYKVNLV